jgi:hypothetical protein
MHRCHLAAAAVVALAGLFNHAAQAELSSRDLKAPGDGLLTFDSLTGLEWLDLTETKGLSAAAVRAGAGGWASLGFRHATTAEVTQLFLDTAPGVTLSNGTSSVSPNNLAGAQRLLDLMGTVYVQACCNSFNVVGNGLAGVDEPGAGFVLGASYGTDLAATGGFFFAPDGQFTSTFSDPNVASYLVLGSAVPEPSQVALLLAGMTGLCVVAKSRRFASTSKGSTC